jgi:hypothetical protein
MRWSEHALKNLADREIPRAEAEAALLNRELSVPARSGRRFFMRRYFDQGLQQEMLVRLLVQEGPEGVVIAVYKTSKISKYMKGTGR